MAGGCGGYSPCYVADKTTEWAGVIAISDMVVANFRTQDLLDSNFRSGLSVYFI